MKDTLTSFQQKYEPVPESGCWIWIAGCNQKGYAQLWDGVRSWKAHRWSYEHFVGPIPTGRQIDHLCRVRCCVNPDHLEPVTSGENVLRGESFAAVYARKTHCPQGHPYSDENTYRRPGNSNRRECRTCARSRVRTYTPTGAQK